MFQVMDTVVHPTAGICRIRDIRKEKFGDSPMLYYVMTPLGDKGSNQIFTPVDSDKIALRLPLKKEDVTAILHDVPDAEIPWDADEKQRDALLWPLLRSGTHAQIIQMIVKLHQLRELRKQEGKKLFAGDERLLAEAQTMIHREFSFALGLDEAETIRYIMKAIAV